MWVTGLPCLLTRTQPSRPLVFRCLSQGRCLTAKVDTISKVKAEREMSSAMRMYLLRKREHDMFISKEREEFDLGKSHLASMMGLDAASMDQSSIDRSIEYLFPSGLHQDARPVMKPPEEIFPKQKEAEFDTEGRPFHPLFYTLKPNYYEAAYKLRDHVESVTVLGDRLQRQGKGPDPEQRLTEARLSGSRWVTQDEVSALCLESVSELEHKELLALLERLAGLPFAYRVKDDIFAWRVNEGTTATQQLFVTPQFDESGRAWVQFEGRRKTSQATVKVTKPGTGKVSIKHLDYPSIRSDITYFFGLKERHAVMFPLQFSKMLGLVDVEAEVSNSGPSAQAGAIRYGLAMCLRSFVERETIDDMKLAGLLTADIRVRERKWYGRVSARKAYTWKRR